MAVCNDAKVIQALSDQLTELERLVKCKYVEFFKIVTKRKKNDAERLNLKTCIPHFVGIKMLHYVHIIKNLCPLITSCQFVLVDEQMYRSLTS